MIALILFKYGVPLDDPCCYPLGFMYVSAHLKAQGHTVKVLNYNLWDYDLGKELEGVTDVFMTGFEEFKDRIIETAAICRGKGIKTHLGGALATFAAHDMTEHVNCLYAGEYDFDMPLSAVPMPDYDGFGVSEYHKRNGIKHMGVLTARGCPFSCTFCAHTCKYRERAMADVFDEIDLYWEKYQPDLIVFNDNTLNVRKDRFMQVCQGMKERGTPWTAAIRVDRFDEEMAKAAKESRAIHFVVGVESLNQQKLDMMNKKTTKEKILSCLDLLNKYKLGYHGNILVGFDGETAKDIEDEINSIPKGYNLIPAMLQPYIGGKLSNKRSISKEEETSFNARFQSFIASKGMCYNI